MTSDQLIMATKQDAILQKVIDSTRNGWPDTADKELLRYKHKRNELSVDNHCLFWGLRVVIPTFLREAVLQELHLSRPGVIRMKTIARGHFWCPHLGSDIEGVGKSYTACLEAKQAPAKAPLHPWTWPSKPWQRIHIDYAGPFVGKKVVDAHSKWGEVIDVPTTNATKTIEDLRQLFTWFGLPSQLVSGNGLQFVSKEFKQFMKSNGIKHTKSTPYHPASNEEAKRFVRTFKESMKASKNENLPLDHKLQNFLLTYQSTPHSTTNVAPADLFLSRSIRTRLHLLKPNLREHVGAQQAKQKDHHDIHAQLTSFQLNQNVMVKNRRAGPNWISGSIVQQVGPVTYLVKVKEGRQQNWFLLFHISTPILILNISVTPLLNLTLMLICRGRFPTTAPS